MLLVLNNRALIGGKIASANNTNLDLALDCVILPTILGNIYQTVKQVHTASDSKF